ncbi:hypothetical protein OXIME_001090 [Oxyplasma meridianum]|uniref:Uncharacterized protein n=1 Tax=Oxyplasma meridianum TaxID=3073602 RepID=A0AAX4NH63_9ARCH
MDVNNVNRNHNLYLYGPYSSELTRDYYDIPETKDMVSDLDENVKKILIFLKDKNALYLEIAATLDSVKSKNKNINNNKLVEMVSDLKSNRLEEKKKRSDYVNDVLEDLSKNNII